VFAIQNAYGTCLTLRRCKCWYPQIGMDIALNSAQALGFVTQVQCCRQFVRLADQTLFWPLKPRQPTSPLSPLLALPLPTPSFHSVHSRTPRHRLSPPHCQLALPLLCVYPAEALSSYSRLRFKFTIFSRSGDCTGTNCGKYLILHYRYLSLLTICLFERTWVGWTKGAGRRQMCAGT